MKPRRLLPRIRAGHTANVAFDDFCRLVEAHGFRHVRTSGSHLVFEHPDAGITLVLVPRGPQARPYQIRAFLKTIDDYDLVAEV